jgi:phospholipid/cholesterol/gamma-HCH transport system ATP-binding protein
VAATAKSSSAIELVDVVKRFGAERVLKGVDLAVPQGAITVLLGPSGAGKTVTISHVFGLIQPTSGVVRVEGKDLAELSEDELYALRRRMSAVLQGTLPFTCGLFYSLNVYENVAFALRARNGRWSEDQVHRVTMDHLGMVGLRDRAGDMPDALSAGMSKRVALARALALDARIVVIDDFDSGIDGVRLALLCELIRDMQRRTEATYLVTTHDMAAARELADHVAVIHDGRIAATGTADSVFDSTDPLVHQLVSGEVSGRSSSARGSPPGGGRRSGSP